MSKSSRKPNKKTKNNVETKDFDTEYDELVEALQENYKQQKKLMLKLKELKAAHKSELKLKSNGKNKGTGFNKPQPVPDSIRKMLKIDEGEEMPRPMVTSLIYEYIKKNNLHNENNKQEIIPNKEMKKAFGMNNDDAMTFQNMQTWIAKVYREA